MVVTFTIVLASAARSPVDASPRRRRDASRSLLSLAFALLLSFLFFLFCLLFVFFSGIARYVYVDTHRNTYARTQIDALRVV